MEKGVFRPFVGLYYTWPAAEIKVWSFTSKMGSICHESRLKWYILHMKFFVHLLLILVSYYLFDTHFWVFVGQFSRLMTAFNFKLAKILTMTHFWMTRMAENEQGKWKICLFFNINITSTKKIVNIPRIKKERGWKRSGCFLKHV